MDVQRQDLLPELTPEQKRLVEQYPHYYKDVRKLAILDVYRVLDLFQVTDPCLQHAAKKCLCAGVRGMKELLQDTKEARDTLNRKLAMAQEDAQEAVATPMPSAAPAALPDLGLLPHELRVVQEHDELQDSTAKLQAFMGTSTFEGLETIERTLLQDQLLHMQCYAHALESRLTIYRNRVAAAQG